MKKRRFVVRKQNILVYTVLILAILFAGCATQDAKVSEPVEPLSEPVEPLSEPAESHTEPAEPLEEQGYYVGGKGPGGGIIFYDDQQGFDFNADGTVSDEEKDILQYSYLAGMRYLESAPRGWNLPESRDDPIVQWGADDANLKEIQDAVINLVNPEPEAIMATVGNGARNTAAIVAYLAERGEETGTAAQICAAYNGGGLTDWFLPSIGELIILHSAKDQIGGFSLDGYNTSSESLFNNLRWVVVFRDNKTGIDTLRKYHKRRVRPIRAFAD